MSITTAEQLEKLRACGLIVAKALRAMSAAVRPGVTTADLSAIAARMLAENGAQSSPPLIYNFPGDLIAATTGRVSLDRDGWTVRTADGSLSAHYEHTIVITKREPILLTAA
jgi:methionine aminopeptidase